MAKKLVIAAGGTGGHIYPAIALAKTFQEKDPQTEIMFIGGGLASNRYFGNRMAFKEVSTGCFSKNPLKLFRGILRICRGFLESRKAIKEFAPDIVVGFGSYYTFPCLVSAKVLGIPIVLHEANSIPGKVNRFFSKYAKATGVHFPEAKQRLKGNVVEVGMPLRAGYVKGSAKREEVFRYFGLDPEKKVILVFGGSQGARVINRLVKELSTFLKTEKDLQILHFTGDISSQREFEKNYKELGILACVKDFEEKMDFAWQAADIAISRSGAGTIAEALEFEVPTLFIPYPHSSDGHQEKNADFMSSTVGGGVALIEKTLSPEKLLGETMKLLAGKEKLASMQLAMKEYKKISRKQDLYCLVKEYL